MAHQRPATATTMLGIARAQEILRHLWAFARHGGDPASAEATAYVARKQHCPRLRAKTLMALVREALQEEALSPEDLALLQALPLRR